MARRADRSISQEDFLCDVRRLAEALPEAVGAFNLCEDRYRFAVAFAALLLRGQVNLLPPNRATDSLAGIARTQPGCYALVDHIDPRLPVPQVAVDEAGTTHSLPPAPPSGPLDIPPGQTAVLAFTSGTTGQPTPHAKTWGQLVESTRQAMDRFGLDRGEPPALVATVPAQHMYGLESAILYALRGQGVLVADRPFFPEYISASLGVQAGALLITTPFHLAACLRAGLHWPTPRMILCATAPLDAALAREAERQFRCPLMEIYGCTEAGAVASRRTTADTTWRTYEEVRLLPPNPAEPEVTRLQGPQHPAPVPLQDHVLPLDSERFGLGERFSDQLNIAGKRASLADLNLRLRGIEGVLDGVFIPPENVEPGAVARLAALVVAPGLDETRILEALARAIDPAFLPRPLILLDRLPRSSTGKLPRRLLLDLLATHQQCA
ncbi:MAG TPA: AMP-binding protein [Thioalkalivibrio sp.]|nr:AMP-binding protein [Thioalkalivibrio sp.]